MALRVIMKRKALTELEKRMAEIREKIMTFETREAELEQAINEAETEEERAAVEEAVEEFEANKAETENEAASLEEKIRAAEQEIAELEAAQATPAPVEEPATEEPEKREVKHTMNKRTKQLFGKMDAETRARVFENEQVRSMLATVREAMTNKRAISGAELTIPEEFLGYVRENIEDYSKLYRHANVRQISGDGRVVVMGTIPEAVWTDACATLNELSLSFNDAEVAAWKVGGYFDICNATLAASDMDLAAELLTTIGQAIGLALDKAIAYGPGNRMPLGVVARLAQTAAPSDYPTTARPWVDLHETNIQTIAAATNGVELFRAIMLASAAAKGKYSRGEKVWVMNETTYTTLKAQAMSINAAGAIVSGVEGTMPVVGGIVEVLDFIPDNVIIGGYFDLYLLAERSGVTLSSSEHAMFIQDRTVFKGTALYDGLPVIAEGFVAIGINGVTPTAGMTFAPDTANGQGGDVTSS